MNESTDRASAQSPPDIELKYYMFDWDDNVLHMPTRIHLERREGDRWVPHSASTSEFARIRNDRENYRAPGGDWRNAFSEFNDGGARGERAFTDDTRAALDAIAEGRAKPAPSFDSFRRALVEGRLFAIITARAHRPPTIRRAVEQFIARILTEDERNAMVGNLKRFMRRFDGEVPELSDAEIVSRYLDLNHYQGVTSEEFKRRSGLKLDGAESPEAAKQCAIREFLRHVFELTEAKAPEKPFSLGFSDDDPHNLQAAERFIREELAAEFPRVKFVIYDTSDPTQHRARKLVLRG